MYDFIQKPIQRQDVLDDTQQFFSALKYDVIENEFSLATITKNNTNILNIIKLTLINFIFFLYLLWSDDHLF